MFSHQYFSEFCRSVAHPTRLAILDEIMAHSNCIEERVLQVPDVSHATLALHLKALKRAGLIKGNIHKSKNSYCIDWEKLETFKLLFDDLYQRANTYKAQVLSNEGKCTKEQ